MILLIDNWFLVLEKSSKAYHGIFGLERHVSGPDRGVQCQGDFRAKIIFLLLFYTPRVMHGARYACLNFQSTWLRS